MMAAKTEAKVLLCRCTEDHSRLFGITIEKRPDNNWNMRYSYPMDEEQAKSEQLATDQLNAVVYTTRNYPGCPYCQRHDFVCCGGCHRLTCFQHGTRETTCAWCDSKLRNIGNGPVNTKGGKA